MDNNSSDRKISSSSENSTSGFLDDFESDIKSAEQSTPAAPRPSTSSGVKRPFRRKRKRMSFPDNDEELFDQNFEETIKSAAVKNNLTPMCVKKLLKKIVVNEHVFAIVRLKEEEETKKIKMNENSQPDTGDGEEDEGEKEEPEPKLTRLKAKQLKQTPFPIASLNEPIPDDEVAALIHQELGSDDDDEEYQPAEDETGSDEDPNTTVSDVESQPRTPKSTATAVEQEHEPEEVQYTTDGLFKIPKPRNDSHCSQSEQEQEQENIALRTRSKLCLTTTAIETIESTFIPPDITNDMYEYDGEMDQAWKDFLEEFTKPLPNNLEDDDDNDPEYVATEGIPFDPEEMRAVNVSKKELNELIMELMEMGGTDDSLLEQTLTETINESLNCRIDDRSEMLSTPVPTEEIDCSNSSVVQPTTVPETESVSVQAQQFPAMPASLSSLPSQPPAVATNQSYNTTQPQMASTQAGCNSAMFPPVYMPPQPNFNVSTEPYNSVSFTDTTLNSTQLIPTTGSDHGKTQQEQISPNPKPIAGSSISRFFVKTTDLWPMTSDAEVSHVSSYYSDATAKTTDCFEPRYRTHSTTIPVEVSVSETEPGMNDFQFLLMHQQLRMHVQLTTQHFIQTYVHPVLGKLAPKFKNMLTELEEIGKAKPNVLPWNLAPAVECCESWEQQLAEDSSKRKLLTKYWTNEIAREEDAQSLQRVYHSDFHWLIREQILSSKAFLYPSLLPYKAFRSCRSGRTSLAINAEKQYGVTQMCFWLSAIGVKWVLFVDIFNCRLIAMWLERGYKKLTKEKYTPSKAEVCAYVAQHFYIKQSPKYFKWIVYKQQTKPGNPIEFFFKHGYAPPIEHVLELFNPPEGILLSQYQRNTLHYNWELYIFSKNRANYRQVSEKGRKQQPTEQHDADQTIGCKAPTLLESKESNVLLKVNVLLPVEPEQVLPEKRDGVQVRNSEKQPIHSISNGTPGTAMVQIPYGSFVVNLQNDNDISSKSSNFYAKNAEAHECWSTAAARSASVIEPNVSDGKRTDNSVSFDAPRNNSTEAIVCGNDRTSSANRVYGRNGTKKCDNYSRSAAVATLYSTLKRYLQAQNNDIRRELTVPSHGQAKHPTFRVYAHFKQLEVYSRFLGELRKMSENFATYQYRPLPQCYFRQAQQGLLRLSCNHRADGSFIVSAEYITDSFDDYQSMEDKDAVYAFNYYEKVEETLVAAGRTDLLDRFEQILRNFDEIEDRVSLLYYQIEDLLGESFPQLVDTFLTFLLPGQAAQVGKFFEHFILTNMSDFLEKLNVFFAKQPAQIKKIHACLNELSNEPDVTMEQVKLKVLPLLKGSTLLTEWFLQLFPGERPPESPISDYEHIAMKKHPTNDTYDAGTVYEHVSFTETLPDGSENPCASNGIRYIQGRIFQGALPARLTFLANSCVTRAVNQTTEESAFSNGDNLCDDSTLMAHAIRLNPLVHCPKGITYADVAHLLVERNGESEVGSSPDVSIAGANVEDESKTGTTSKKLTPKLPLKKRFNSPISRKAGASPGDEKLSPGSGSKEAANAAATTTTTPKKNTTSTVLVTVPPESKALASARRLKALLEAPPQTCSQEEQQPADPCSSEQQGGNVKERLEVSSEQPIPNTTASEETSSSANVAVETHQPKPPEASKGNENVTEAPSWTREEDKIILQDIVKGFTSVDTFVRQIEAKIPDRTSEQIRSRFEFLHRMLRQVNQK
ncbi:uncharacterized protein LOC118508536 isoform X1 [Anopheles stephensi]|uniref:uncharacterized protein LOC118508536 isoform X1 n=1 Tax=Anopheles stephensi TaxID=30069 RepID=UPI001658BD3F|nr:uncharacterized protein LOC118508536 isoform X1 [Anopheles stephensi]